MSDLGALARDLAGDLAPERVRARALDLALYRRDASIIEGEAGLVCFPLTTEEVVAAVRAARRHGVPFLARGSGTGLAGGAVPLHHALVIVLSRMNRILEVDVANRAAWVEPGVINLDLSTHTRPLGLHYAPDPSSQQTCSIGGNVATNSGGPHCLASGVTADHVLAVEVVLPDGDVVMLGGLAPEYPGLDIRGLLVGSEGTLGIVTKILVRLMPDPPAIRTILLGFPTVEGAAGTVSGIIGAGLLPAALEMMDQQITVAVENFVHAGLPLDAAAILLVEIDGLPAGLPAQEEVIREVATRHGATHVRVAADEAERQLLWKGRKSAFGAIAQIAPNYYLHDCVVPRTRLVEVLAGVYAIGARYGLTMLNVFHAGDGNLHPLIVFDRREPGRMEQVLAAGHEIIELCVAAGGVLSGEHGIGLEKRDAMPLIFSPADLDQQARLAEAFDPEGLTNPEKVLPKGSRCGEIGLRVADAPAGAWI